MRIGGSAMCKVIVGVVLGMALALLASPLGGCSATEAGSQPTASSEESTQGPAFGPVYEADETSDGLIAETIRIDAEDPYGSKSSSSTISTAPAVSAEIRGYLVDWMTGENPPHARLELVVLKDGSILRIPDMRPAGGWGVTPSERLGPEPDVERTVRDAVVEAADNWVKSEYSECATATPVVYNYLVRIHRSDGSFSDVWVDPQPDPGRMFYDVTLRPVE